MFYIRTGRVLILAIFFAFLFLGSVQPTFAAAPSLLTYPTSVDTDTAFTVTATMSGLTGNALYRLRLVFAPPGTFNYFGSTYNGTNWYNGTPAPIDYSKFLTITTDGLGSWNGSIQGKAELTDPNFDGTSGTYDFKLGRYTQSGTAATWSNVVSMPLTAPTPTPLPTSTPTPTLTPVPTNTPTPTPTKMPTPTIKATPPASPSSTLSPTDSIPAEVLGTESSKLTSPTPFITRIESERTANNFPKAIIAVGVILLGVCGILLFRQIRTQNESENNNN